MARSHHYTVWVPVDLRPLAIAVRKLGPRGSTSGLRLWQVLAPTRGLQHGSRSEYDIAGFPVLAHGHAENAEKALVAARREAERLLAERREVVSDLSATPTLD